MSRDFCFFNRLLTGEDLDGVFDLDQLKDDIFEGIKAFGEKITTEFKELFQKISSGEDVTSNDLEDFARIFTDIPVDYIDYWINNIDVGLRHWGDLGLAISRAVFDPQSARDVENDGGASYGADVADPDFLYYDRRGSYEDGVGMLSVLFDEFDDPNNDGSTDDSFINQYLLPMAGMPHKVGELRAEIQKFWDELVSQVIEPTRELLGDINPLDPVLDFLTNMIKEWAKDELLRPMVMDVFGFDIELFDYIENLSTGRLDIRSIELITPKDIEALSSVDLETEVVFTDHGYKEGDDILFTGIEQEGWTGLNSYYEDRTDTGFHVTTYIDDRKRQEVLGPFLIPQGIVKVGDVLGAKEDPGLLCKGPWHPALFHPHRERVKNKEPVKLLFEFPENDAGCSDSIFFAPCRLKRHGHCS